MFWKRADSRTSGVLRSIGVRLTLFYTLASLAAVVIFTAVVYWKLANNFDAEHLRFLRAKAHELVEDFRDGGGRPSALLSEIGKETAGTSLRQYEARVLSSHEMDLGGTPGMNALLPRKLFPPSVSPVAITSATVRSWYVQGQHYQLVAFDPNSVKPAAERYTVQLALNVSRDDALLADYRQGLGVFLLLLLPVLLVAGRIVTVRGLRPLGRVVRAANAITPTHLESRIPLDPPWPPELTSLVRVFNDMLGRLDQAFTRLARFSADLAHELRNPVNNLMGEMEVCLARERTADEYRVALKSGLEECRRLAGLIENLLFIARAENTEKSLCVEQFDAREVCGRVLEQYASMAAARGVRLACDGDAQLHADRQLFRQAFDNLLTNAIRYSPSGSEIRVTIRELMGGGVEVETRDQGEGIPPEHVSHLFERFYQVDPARTRHGQGTGLGLAIVRSIMNLHGGEVSLESVLGTGTTVRLRFPAVLAK